MCTLRDPAAAFHHNQVEAQLEACSCPVSLRSGGYSSLTRPKRSWRSTELRACDARTYCIEDTALKTNLEAADEVARQLRLRDLAGLIVIDFIDMDEAA